MRSISRTVSSLIFNATILCHSYPKRKFCGTVRLGGQPNAVKDFEAAKLGIPLIGDS